MRRNSILKCITNSECRKGSKKSTKLRKFQNPHMEKKKKRVLKEYFFTHSLQFANLSRALKLFSKAYVDIRRYYEIGKAPHVME